MFSSKKRIILEMYEINYFILQVVIWWAGLMRGAVSVALAYNKVREFFVF